LSACGSRSCLSHTLVRRRVAIRPDSKNFRDAKIGAAQGRIALQIHDGGGIKVLWRNFRLETL